MDEDYRLAETALGKFQMMMKEAGMQRNRLDMGLVLAGTTHFADHPLVEKLIENQTAAENSEERVKDYLTEVLVHEISQKPALLEQIRSVEIQDSINDVDLWLESKLGSGRTTRTGRREILENITEFTKGLEYERIIESAGSDNQRDEDDRQLAADMVNSPITLTHYLQKREIQSASGMKSYHRSFNADEAVGFAHYINDLRTTVSEHLYTTTPLFGGHDEQLDRHWLATNHEAAQAEIDRLNLKINDGPYDSVLAKFNRENPGGDIMTEAELGEITSRHASEDREPPDIRPSRERDNAGFGL